MNTVTTPRQESRLLSLDILRGITVAGMIMVNNPGSWQYVYTPLGHAPWHGLTPTDLVFPFFMFIMGVSAFMSLQKFRFKPSGPAVWKIVRRTLLIFVIGLGLGWFGQLCSGLAAGESAADAATHFDTLRIPGVLQRLALAYGFAALVAVSVKSKYLPAIIVLLLSGYFLILQFGKGFEQSEQNIIASVDRALWGAGHMYKDVNPQGERIAFDPEGLLSTLPSIAHVLIGFLFGKLIVDNRENHVRVEKLLIGGTLLAFAGLLLQYGCPLNKKIWSPTFVLVTTGFAAQLLGLLIRITDIHKKERWSRFFRVFGVNPLAVYVFAGILATLLSAIRITYRGGETVSIKGFVYEVLLRPWAGNYAGSLLYALLFVAACRLFGYLLYKRNIYIKI
ncbi:MAG: heparan-alpha-glucosaminide N-acetyltransferase domain-containing protein [Proteiniphilum sp.]|jgi:predicted acyltransferase|nr:heparan-alpha-glucosaminide N-acetyltransferase domain-containing protein [Proteiniphilum sp.]